MRNAGSMPAISCGREIMLRSYLSTRPILPARFVLYSCLKTSSLIPLITPRRVSIPRRQLQLASVRSCSGKALVQDTPIEWTRNRSSVRLFATARDTGGKQAIESEVESITGGDLGPIGKPEICTADELHYVAVPKTTWRLALWRYRPSKSAPKRNHPVLMLSGIGTNAIGFDLDPSASLARHLAAAGFDSWILEVRGSGLSKREGEPTSSELGGTDGALNGAVQDAFVQATVKSATKAAEKKGNGAVAQEKNENPLKPQSNALAKVDKSSKEEDSVASRMTSRITQISQTLRSLVSEGQSRVSVANLLEQVTSLLEDKVLNERFENLRERLTALLEGPQTNSVASQVAEFSNSVTALLEEGQRSVTPSVTSLQERLTATITEFQEVLELIAKYDWDFDTYLQEDVPAAMEYVINHTGSPDGKVLGVGHSMGGILLYAMLAIREERAGLAGAVSLASSLDYAVSDTSLKMLLPLTDPAQRLNVPVVPLGALMTAIHPLSTRPPYALAYLGYQVSARSMMEPELFKKLVCNNFCTIPVKLLLQLATVFKPGGLQNRDGTVKYMERLHSCKVPVLAVAGDEDLICPPIAVSDTLKVFPQANVTYKLFGGEDDRHYGHYDLLCSRTAKREVYPVITDFLVKCDNTKVDSSG
ncbi:uncharacterized protein [Physcomitrium patens]|uniref:AB hydrolase-1 domain-containing protein n=1 Tax=Physcomitrium patens TaxID=3218 RepID=A0A2K1KFE3_PHYPA|nr:uncharacterized protein LOC112283570 isoform X1 [Physcomitrium patens]PNR52504.1 hypothetical protein PHYPA_008878 [Physcomitrium patens]|eukprot:XP_024378196.1 uncharacterized protein LOC112283570 isoform X1 [Physcomitrella patens]